MYMRITIPVAVVAVTTVFPAVATNRLWNPADDTSEHSITDGSSWTPQFATATDMANDVLAINCTTSAYLKAGETYSGYQLYVGKGSVLNGDGNFVQNASYDNGASLYMSGGTLKISDALWIGGGYADNHDSLFDLESGAVTVNYLQMGDCASNNGKKNVLNIGGSTSPASFTASIAANLSIYSGGTSIVNVMENGVLNAASLNVGEKGRGVLNVSSGEIVVSGMTVFNSNGSSTASGSAINLNGGVLKTKQISAGNNSATATFNWNGGTLKQSGEESDVFANTERYTVNVMYGGARFDSEGTDRSTAVGLSGVGAFVKSGEGTLTLTGAQGEKGGFVVERGKLVVSGSISSSETSPLWKIEVGSTDDLDLGNQTVYVTNYKVDGVAKDAGTYVNECGGTVVVTSVIDKSQIAWYEMRGGNWSDSANWFGVLLDGVTSVAGLVPDLADKPSIVITENAVARLTADTDITGIMPELRSGASIDLNGYKLKVSDVHVADGVATTPSIVNTSETSGDLEFVDAATRPDALTTLAISGNYSLTFNGGGGWGDNNPIPPSLTNILGGVIFTNQTSYIRTHIRNVQYGLTFAGDAKVQTKNDWESDYDGEPNIDNNWNASRWSNPDNALTITVNGTGNSFKAVWHNTQTPFYSAKWKGDGEIKFIAEGFAEYKFGGDASQFSGKIVVEDTCNDVNHLRFTGDSAKDAGFVGVSTGLNKFGLKLQVEESGKYGNITTTDTAHEPRVSLFTGVDGAELVVGSSNEDGTFAGNIEPSMARSFNKYRNSDNINAVVSEDGKTATIDGVDYEIDDVYVYINGDEVIRWYVVPNKTMTVKKVGTGTWTLNGDCNHLGATTIAEGEVDFARNVTNSSITVKSGAAIGGAGNIAKAVTFESGSVLSGSLTLQEAPVVAYGAVMRVSVENDNTVPFTFGAASVDLSGFKLEMSAEDMNALDGVSEYVVANGPSGVDYVVPAIDLSLFTNGWRVRKDGTQLKLSKTGDGWTETARIGQTVYPSLSVAIAAAQANETIVLMSDNNETAIDLAAKKDFRIDANGYSMSTSIVSSDYAIETSVSGTVTTYTMYDPVASVTVNGVTTNYKSLEAAGIAAGAGGNVKILATSFNDDDKMVYANYVPGNTSDINIGITKDCTIEVTNGATFVSSAHVNVGRSANHTGRLLISDGSVTMNKWISCGDTVAGAIGILEVTGGSFTQESGNFQIGQKDDGTTYGRVIVSGTGIVTITSGCQCSIGRNGISKAEVTVSENGQFIVQRNIDFLHNQRSTTLTDKTMGVVNIDGGIVSSKGVWLQASNANNSDAVAEINFNGGAFMAHEGASSSFIPNDDRLHLNILVGGAKIDTNGQNIQIAKAFSAPSEVTAPTLTKKGAGALTLSATTVPVGFTVQVEYNGGSVVVPAEVKSSVTPGAHTRWQTSSSNILVYDDDNYYPVEVSSTSCVNVPKTWAEKNMSGIQEENREAALAMDSATLADCGYNYFHCYALGLDPAGSVKPMLEVPSVGESGYSLSVANVNPPSGVVLKIGFKRFATPDAAEGTSIGTTLTVTGTDGADAVGSVSVSAADAVGASNVGFIRAVIDVEAAE